MSDTNRMAELALELFGAKAASEFLQQAWDIASHEDKQRLAAAILKRAEETLRDDKSWSKSTWEARSMYERAVRDLVEKHLTERKAEIEASIREYVASDAIRIAVEKRCADVADKLVSGALKTISDELLTKVNRKLGH